MSETHIEVVPDMFLQHSIGDLEAVDISAVLTPSMRSGACDLRKLQLKNMKFLHDKTRNMCFIMYFWPLFR